jgi:NADPH-dependent FMN reductase
MRALILNCTLKPSPAESNTGALADLVDEALVGAGVEVERLRVVDHDVKPGVSSDEGDGDAWAAIRERILSAQILVMATPTWLGKPSSIAQRVCELIDSLVEIGFTVPGQSWTYWNMGPGAGPSYTETGHGHEWSAKTAKLAASNLVAVAKALEANPVPPPPG